MISRLDLWLGSRVFVPGVIYVCQRAGVSQWCFHSHAWMVATWLLLVTALKLGPDTAAVHAAIATYFTAMAALSPEREIAPRPMFRKVVMIAEAIHWGGHALFELGVISDGILFWGVKWNTSCLFALTILAAEYALTIKTIPPRETETALRPVEAA